MTEKIFEINISKRRTEADNFGIHWAKVTLPDCDEEKAKEKMDMLKLIFGERFIITMTIKEV